MQPVLKEHGKNNLGPEIDAPAADVFIEDQRSDSGSDAGDNDEGAAEPYIEDHRSENAHGDGYDSSSLKDAEENNDIHETDPMTERQTRYSLRPNRARNYNHQLGHIMDEPGKRNELRCSVLATRRRQRWPNHVAGSNPGDAENRMKS
jgi:hypothetical protein